MHGKKDSNQFQPDAEVRWLSSVANPMAISSLPIVLGKFLGQRFIKGNDVGLVLIYDVQGSIAGVQMAVSGWLFPSEIISDSLE